MKIWQATILCIIFLILSVITGLFENCAEPQSLLLILISFICTVCTMLWMGCIVFICYKIIQKERRNI